MLRLFMDGTLFWSADLSELSAEYGILELKQEAAINEAGKLTFSFLTLHPRYAEMKAGWSGFALANDNTCLFLGRLKTLTEEFNGTVSAEVSDMFGALDECLYEFDSQSVDPDGNFEYWYVLVSDFCISLAFAIRGITEYEISSLIAAPPYNQIANNGKSVINSVLVNRDEFQKTRIENGDKPRFKNMQSVVLENLLEDDEFICISYSGGQITEPATYEKIYEKYVYSGVTVTIYLYDNRGCLAIPDVTRTFRFGENLLDITKEEAQSDLITYFVPIATDERDQSYTTDPQYSMSLIEKYGLRRQIIDFGSIDEDYTQRASEFIRKLNEKASKFKDSHLLDYGFKYTFKGIDPYFLGSSSYSRPLEIGEFVVIIDPVHDITVEDFHECLSLSVDYFNHQNDQYIIGPYLSDNVYDPKISS